MKNLSALALDSETETEFDNSEETQQRFYERGLVINPRHNLDELTLKAQALSQKTLRPLTDCWLALAEMKKSGVSEDDIVKDKTGASHLAPRLFAKREADKEARAARPSGSFAIDDAEKMAGIAAAHDAKTADFAERCKDALSDFALAPDQEKADLPEIDQQIAIINQLLPKMKKCDSVVLDLAFNQNLRPLQIAAKLKKSDETIYKAIDRAKPRLQKLLAEYQQQQRI